MYTCHGAAWLRNGFSPYNNDVSSHMQAGSVSLLTLCTRIETLFACAACGFSGAQWRAAEERTATELITSLAAGCSSRPASAVQARLW